MAVKQDILKAAKAYGADPQTLLNIARLESGFNPKAINLTDSNARAGHPSQGVFQYIPSTFASFAPKARAANPAAWRGVPLKYLDPRAQALTTAWAIQNGLGSHWSTFDRARAGRPVKGPKGSASFTGTLARSGGGMDPGRRAKLAFIFQGSPFADVLANMPDEEASVVRAPAGLGKINVPTGKMDYRWIQKMGQKLFGLRNDAGDSQTTGGRHSAGSEHYSGRAVDFGTAKNSRAQLNAWMAWAKKQGLDVLWEGDHAHVSSPGEGI